MNPISDKSLLDNPIPVWYRIGHAIVFGLLIVSQFFCPGALSSFHLDFQSSEIGALIAGKFTASPYTIDLFWQIITPMFFGYAFFYSFKKSGVNYFLSVANFIFGVLLATLFLFSVTFYITNLNIPACILLVAAALIIFLAGSNLKIPWDRFAVAIMVVVILGSSHYGASFIIYFAGKQFIYALPSLALAVVCWVILHKYPVKWHNSAKATQWIASILLGYSFFSMFGLQMLYSEPDSGDCPENNAKLQFINRDLTDIYSLYFDKINDEIVAFSKNDFVFFINPRDGGILSRMPLKGCDRVDYLVEAYEHGNLIAACSAPKVLQINLSERKIVTQSDISETIELEGIIKSPDNEGYLLTSVTNGEIIKLRKRDLREEMRWYYPGLLKSHPIIHDIYDILSGYFIIVDTTAVTLFDNWMRPSIKSVKMGANARSAIDIKNKRLYVIDSVWGTLTSYDIPGLDIVKRVKIPRGALYVYTHPDYRNIITAHFYEGKLYFFDKENFTVTDEQYVGFAPRGAIIAPERNLFYGSSKCGIYKLRLE